MNPVITVETSEFVCQTVEQPAAVAIAQARTGDVTVNNQINMPPVLVNVAIPGNEASRPIPPSDPVGCDSNPKARSGKQPRKATIAARMIDLIKDPTTHTWSIRQFAEKLECSPTAIHKTSAWEQLSVSREMARETRAAKAYKKNLSKE